MENKTAHTLWQRRIEPVLVVLARLVVGATFALFGVCQVNRSGRYIVEDKRVPRSL